MTKLTLSMDAEVIAAAKRLAKRRHMSVSSMLANMVKAMEQHEAGAPELPPDSLSSRALGLVKPRPGLVDGDARFEELCSKYGIERE